jgi:hypothetical protein
MFAALPDPVVGAIVGLVVVLGLAVALNLGGISDGVARRHHDKLEHGNGGYIRNTAEARRAGWFFVAAGLLAAALMLIV